MNRLAIKLLAFVAISATLWANTFAQLTSINANGWSGTYTSPPTFNPSGSPETISVTRAGFDTSGNTTTHTSTITLTSRIRQPYPNQSLWTSDQVALSRIIYDDDTIVGGLTNNSTIVSPKPVANWVMPHRLTVGNSIDLEVVAFHRDARNSEQVACVKFIATDGTNTVSQFVSTSVVSGKSYDKHAVIVYRTNLDVTTLNAGLITCNAEIYPWIGVASSIAKSADSAVLREFSPRYFLKNTSLAAAPIYAYVATGGNDTTGAVSSTVATAAASPCATIAGAIARIQTVNGKADGCIIRLGDDGGTPWAVGSVTPTITQNVGCLTITRDPTVAKANARMGLDASALRPKLTASLTSPLTEGSLLLDDIQIERTGVGQFQGEAATQLQAMFRNVDFNVNSNVSNILNNAHDYHFGTTFTSVSSTMLAATTLEHRLWRGVTATGLTNIEGWCTVGCSFTTVNSFGRAANGRTQSGMVFAYNTCMSLNPNLNFIELGTTGTNADVSGAAIVQNVFEYIPSSSTAAVVHGLSNDSKTGNNTHIILHHNTYTGAYQLGRFNAFYEDGPTARTSTQMSVQGNIIVSYHCKGDVFRGANEAGGDASTRVGNWEAKYGVNHRDNYFMYEAISAVGQGSNQGMDYEGIRSVKGISTSVRNDPLFTDYKASTYNGTSYTAGAGGGTYTLTSSTPCKNMVLPILRYDLAGNPRSSNLSAAGAFEAPNSAPSNISLTASAIAENSAINTTVGALSSTDSDSGDTFTYSLVAGTGSTDNASFNISGTSLRSSASFDYETKASYAIRIRSTDSFSNTFDKQFTITVTDVVEGSPSNPGRNLKRRPRVQIWRFPRIPR